MARQRTADSDSRSSDRRSFLSAAGAVAVGSVSGCLSLLSGDPLTIGYRPSFETLQGVVMVERGYLNELGVSVEAINFDDSKESFSNGLRGGVVEIGVVNLYSAIGSFYRVSDTGLTRANTNTRITAANNVDDRLLLARGEFARLWDEHGSAAFEVFREQHGRRVKLDAGDDVDRWWLDRLDVSPDLVEFVTTYGGVEGLRSKLREEELDGAIATLPRPTKLSRMDVPLEAVAWIGDSGPACPAGLTVMAEDLWREQPDLATGVLEQHANATEFIENNPGEAAALLSETMRDGPSTGLATDALQAKTANYVTNSRQVVEPTKELLDLRIEDDPREPIPAEDLFELSLYRNI